jgi:hypothetical protein
MARIIRVKRATPFLGIDAANAYAAACMHEPRFVDVWLRRDGQTWVWVQMTELSTPDR